MPTITLTDKQLKALSQAAELMSRLYCGQFDQIDWMVLPYQHMQEEDRNEARVLLERLKHIAYPELGQNAYYGIANTEVCDNARRLFDMHQVFRHYLSWKDNPKGDITVDFDRPMPFSGERIPTIKD